MTSVLVSPGDHDLAAQLESLGARVIAWPQPNLSEAGDTSALDQAIADLFGYDWLILKNDRAAEYFLRRFRLDNSAESLDQLRVLAIGETTTERLIDSQIHVDAALDRRSFKNVFGAIESYLGGHGSISRLNFLVPCAGTSREDFERQLEATGARVDPVIAYRTTANTQKLSHIKALLFGGAIASVAFTSPVALEEFAQLFDTDDLSHLLGETSAACIDSMTQNIATNFALISTRIPTGTSVEEFANLLISTTSVT